MVEKVKFICNYSVKNEAKGGPLDPEHIFNSPEYTIHPGNGLPLFRRDFDLPEHCVKVTVSATALGVFDLYINGKPVGDEEMRPGWTDYH